MLQIQSNDEHGDVTTVVLDAQQGGVVVAYSTHTAAGIVDWFTPANAEHPACFAMVPFCSRIANSEFSFENHEVSLTPNNLPEPHAIHGHGFQRAWQVQAQHPNEVVLMYEHEPDAWPWGYRATARYALQGMYLQVEVSVENLSTHNMPVGLGLHPFFSRASGAELQADVAYWLQLNTQLLPTALRPLPAELDLRRGLKLGRFELDHVFTGWQVAALLKWPAVEKSELPERRLALQSSCPYLVVWAPPGQDFFCVEGVSNLPDAFNGRVADLLRSEEGFVRLPAHEVYRCTWDFAPQLMGVG